ncbi:hypothetical protein, partial [Polymorphospora rubra]|uniref:hypothetical protein n=1 Tax=Polymorphospora rubra TaxID=338584 RepID=UPI0033F66D8F
MTDNRFDFHRSPNEPAWMVEITGEWVPQVPGQRYPGDTGPLRNGTTARRRPTASGRAGVYQSGQRPTPPPGPFPPRLTGVDGHGAHPRPGRPETDERRPPYPDAPFTDGRGRWSDGPGPRDRRYDDAFPDPRGPQHDTDPRSRRHDGDRRGRPYDGDPGHGGAPGPRDRWYDGPPDGPGRDSFPDRRDGRPDRPFVDGRGGRRPEGPDRWPVDDAPRGPGDGRGADRRGGPYTDGRGVGRGYDGRGGPHTDARGRAPFDGRGGPPTDGRGRAPLDGHGPHHDGRDPGRGPVGRDRDAYPAGDREHGGYGPDQRGLDRRAPGRPGPDRPGRDGRWAAHSDDRGPDGWRGPQHPDDRRRDGWDGPHDGRRRDGSDGAHDGRGRDGWDGRAGRGAGPRPPEPEPRHPRDRDPYATGPVSPPAGGPRLYGEPRPRWDEPPPGDTTPRPDDRRRTEPEHYRPPLSRPDSHPDQHRQPGRPPTRHPDRPHTDPWEVGGPGRDHDPRRGPGHADVGRPAAHDEPYGRGRSPLPEQPDAALGVPPAAENLAGRPVSPAAPEDSLPRRVRRPVGRDGFQPDHGASTPVPPRAGAPATGPDDRRTPPP